MKHLPRSIYKLPDKFWTKVELHELYKEKRGEGNKRSRFLTKLIAYLKNETYVLHSLDLLVLSWLKKVSSMLKIFCEDHNDDDYYVSMQRIPKRIKEEIEISTKRKIEYNTINAGNLFDECSDECSSTLISFLFKLSSSFDKSLNTTIIGASVTSVLTATAFIPWYFGSW